MSDSNSNCDAVSMAVGLVVFALPFTLLVPGFSVWDVVPKLRVSRFHIVEQSVTWTQLNASLVSLLVLFFCLYLELRKRELAEMVVSVITASKATDAVMQAEHERQGEVVRACVQLLDASTDHYEALILLEDDLRQRDRRTIHHPPVCEPSTSDA